MNSHQSQPNVPLTLAIALFKPKMGDELAERLVLSQMWLEMNCYIVTITREGTIYASPPSPILSLEMKQPLITSPLPMDFMTPPSPFIAPLHPDENYSSNCAPSPCTTLRYGVRNRKWKILVLPLPQFAPRPRPIPHATNAHQCCIQALKLGCFKEPPLY